MTKYFFMRTFFLSDLELNNLWEQILVATNIFQISKNLEIVIDWVIVSKLQSNNDLHVSLKKKLFLFLTIFLYFIASILSVHSSTLNTHFSQFARAERLVFLLNAPTSNEICRDVTREIQKSALESYQITSFSRLSRFVMKSSFSP